MSAKRTGAVLRKKPNAPSLSDPMTVAIPAGEAFEVVARIRPDGSGYVEVIMPPVSAPPFKFTRPSPRRSRS